MPTLQSNLPVLELIRQNLLETLAGISPDTGYQTTVIAQEPDRLGEPQTDGVYVVATLNLGNAAWNPEIQINNLKEWVQEFVIPFTCSQPEATDGQTPMSADQMRILASCDLEKALDQDPHRGGLAANTIPEAPEWFPRTDGQHEGAAVRRYVVYRTEWNDPYALRT